MALSYDRSRNRLEFAISRRALVGVVVLLHGPVDVGLALALWQLETNSIVTLLGAGPWIGIKVLALSALPIALWSIDRDPWLPGDELVTPYANLVAVGLLSVSILLAVALIVPNLIIAVGWLT